LELDMNADKNPAGLQPDDLFLALSWLLFGGCLVMPAYYLDAKAVPGFGALTMGWLGLWFGQLSWLANPLFLFALLTVRKAPEGSLVAVWLALILALSFVSNLSVPSATHPRGALATSIGWGYYCWVTAIALLTAAQTRYVYGVSKGFSKIPPAGLVDVGIVLVVSAVSIGQWLTALQEQRTLAMNREQFMAANCPAAIEVISDKLSGVEALYFSTVDYGLARSLLSDKVLTMVEMNESGGKPIIQLTGTATVTETHSAVITARYQYDMVAQNGLQGIHAWSTRERIWDRLLGIEVASSIHYGYITEPGDGPHVCGAPPTGFEFIKKVLR
jgi:hypothetical protein